MAERRLNKRMPMLWKYESDRQVRVSRNVEEQELENALRSLPPQGAKMKELLLQLFHLDECETAVPRTADPWLILPRYWVRLHHERRDCYFHPDDTNSPADGLLSDCLWVIGTQCSLSGRKDGLIARCPMAQ